MTDEDVRAIAAWMAHDPSDFAQRCREILRPFAVNLAQALAGSAAHLEVFHDHHRRSIMRRKLRKIV